MRSPAICILAAVLQSGPAFASNEELAVQEAIRENYATYSGYDEARYRTTTTDDFLLLEQGEVIDREGDVAYAVYVLKSDITDDARGTRIREWLESAILRRDGSRWKMALLHSTRVNHPAGASDMRQFGVRYAAAWSSRLRGMGDRRRRSRCEIPRPQRSGRLGSATRRRLPALTEPTQSFGGTFAFRRNRFV